MNPVAAVREFFLLQGALRTARAYESKQLETVRALVIAARRRRAATRSASSAWTEPGGASLAREALALYIRAAEVAKDAKVDPAEVDVAAALTRMSDQPRIPEGWELAAVALRSSDPLFLDKLDPREFGKTRRALDATARWVGAKVESRTPAAVRTTSICRLAVIAVVVLYGIFALIRAQTRGPENIALGKAVIASSTHPATKADATPLVDGQWAKAFGFHTNTEEKPWVQIDLGKAYDLAKVVVHNRADGFLDANLPLALEFAVDLPNSQAGQAGNSQAGQAGNYTEVARQAELFEPGHPWVIDVTGKQARYIRLRAMRNTFLALASVEVYAAP